MNENVPEPQLAALKEEHRLLNERIAELTAQPSINQLELARLKRQKLKLKDQIQLELDRSVPDIIA